MCCVIDLFINNATVRRADLLKCGFKDSTIKKLVTRNVLTKVSNGVYSLTASVLLDENLVPLEKKNNIQMFEPLDLEDADVFLGTINPDCRSYVFDDNGKKRIILRYVDSNNLGVDVSTMISIAESFYESGFYSAFISSYELVLPLIAEPKSDVYLRLGYAYERLLLDDPTNAFNMISYYTLAEKTLEKEVEEAKKNGSEPPKLFNLPESFAAIKSHFGYDGTKIERAKQLCK